MSRRRQREDPCAICSHYHDFEGGEPCSVCGHVLVAHEKKQNDSVIPSTVEPGFLYLGSYDSASRSGLLKTMGITHILNTVPTCQALFKNTFTYHTLATSPPVFEECYKVIEEWKQVENSKVLVYCMSGMSRSPAVVVAYLMRSRGWRLAESYKWVKEKRPSIHINQEESKRLMEYEQQLHGSCSAPLGLASLDASCGAFSAPSAFAPSPSMPGPVFGASDRPDGSTPTAAAPVFGGNSWSMSSTSPSNPIVFGANACHQQQQQSTFEFSSNTFFQPTAGGPAFTLGAGGTVPKTASDMEM